MAEYRETGRIRAPAKVNLSLLVGPRRKDGYHELCTAFCPVDLFDELAFDLTVEEDGGATVESAAADREGAGNRADNRDDLDITCPGVACADNLMSEAVKLVEDEADVRLRGTVSVTKRIPLAAGMGGGSSDAATMLLLAAHVTKEAGGSDIPPGTLHRFATSLGADVPFFLEPQPSLARGIGEVLDPLELPRLPLVLVFPEARLSTAEVYRTFDGVGPEETSEAFHARCRRVVDGWRSLSAAWSSGDLSVESAGTQVASLLLNDLEPAAFHLVPDLHELKATLESRGVLGALVSGSGPTVFGVCGSDEEAAAVVRSLDRDGIEARFVTAGNAA